MNISRNLRHRVIVLAVHKRNVHRCSSTPQHLICFKQWTTDMVVSVLCSAINLKSCMRKGGKSSVLQGCKIMTLQEVNQPVLSMAVSKAATMLGAHDFSVTDKILWDQDYNGKVFSYMADAIFASTNTHQCLQRFANQAHVPVLCMQSRTHATIQSLATIMAVIEEFSSMKGLNVAWLGPPHPVLNSYLLLCPMLGANIKFKCCCDKTPVSPLLLQASQDMTEHSHTHATPCDKRDDVFVDVNVIIAGPTTTKPEKLKNFVIELKDFERIPVGHKWIFFHTFPRGPEVNDTLFNHAQARTYNAFENFQFVAAALMAFCIKNHTF